jgi:hypothetical protein
MYTMKTPQILGLIVATIALAVLAITPVIAQTTPFAEINNIEVNGVRYTDFATVPTTGVFAGDIVPVRVTFTGLVAEDEVRIVARVLGEPGFSEVTERFDVLQGSTYSRLLNLAVPFDIDPNEKFTLEISIESNAQEGDSVQIELEVQRTSYELEVLFVEMAENVKAGETVPVDVVIKNRGRHEAEDTFVRVSIPALGVSRTVFLEDLSAVDQGGSTTPDKEDSEFGRIFLKIPSRAAAGVYNVEIEAFNSDSSTIVTKKVVIGGASQVSTVIAGSNSKTFAAGEDRTYSMTIVNAGNSIEIYQLVLESNPELKVELDESIVAVPAGSSRTVQFTVSASEDGRHDFAVNVHSNGELVKREAYVANVEGNAGIGGTGNAAVLLTVILAIVFVVLLIVLIVLLTRKPEKSEEFGESYY